MGFIELIGWVRLLSGAGHPGEQDIGGLVLVCVASLICPLSFTSPSHIRLTPHSQLWIIYSSLELPKSSRFPLSLREDLQMLFVNQLCLRLSFCSSLIAYEKFSSLASDALPSAVSSRLSHSVHLCVSPFLFPFPFLPLPLTCPLSFHPKYQHR